MSSLSSSPAFVEYMFGRWSYDIPRLRMNQDIETRKTGESPRPSMVLEPRLQGLLQFNLQGPTEPVSTASSLAHGLANTLLNHARNTSNPYTSKSYPLTSPCGYPESSLLHGYCGGFLPSEQWHRNDEFIDSSERISRSPLGTQLQNRDHVLDDALDDIRNGTSFLTSTSIPNNNGISHLPYSHVAEPKEYIFPEQRHIHCKRKQKEHKCPVCQEYFATHRKLRLHARVHILQQAHVCPICNKIFVKRNAMVMHMRLHITE